MSTAQNAKGISNDTTKQSLQYTLCRNRMWKALFLPPVLISTQAIFLQLLIQQCQTIDGYRKSQFLFICFGGFTSQSQICSLLFKPPLLFVSFSHSSKLYFQCQTLLYTIYYFNNYCRHLRGIPLIPHYNLSTLYAQVLLRWSPSLMFFNAISLHSTVYHLGINQQYLHQ